MAVVSCQFSVERVGIKVFNDADDLKDSRTRPYNGL